jgi:hypothetical protein
VNKSTGGQFLEGMVGKIFSTKGGTDCKVIEYKGCRDITIQFLDEHKYIEKVHLKTLRSGGVKNPYDKTIYGHGYIGVGAHKLSFNGRDTKVYKLWASVICRTYHEYSLSKYPTYRDCTVCDAWLCFQTFAEWYESNKFSGLGYSLDKDILSEGEKVYSPETCVFIPQEINTLFLTNSYRCGYLPIGVTQRGKNGRYRALVSKKGVRVDLGNYETPQEASAAYVIGKEAYVKEVAIKWKGKIDNRVFNKLMNWKVYQ